MKKQVKEVKAALTEPPKRESPILDSDWLSMGVDLLNLGLTGVVDRGLAKGYIYRFFGKPSSGKTFLARTVLAEACLNSNFDGYELIYDDVEQGALMDTKKFFGQRLVDRLVPPARAKDKSPIYSTYVSDFYARLKKKLAANKSVIWIEDSLDSLKPDAPSKMTDGKAKAHSQGLRELLDLIKATKSILILISQAKVDLQNQGFFGPTYTTSGGAAPEYYSTAEVFLRKSKTLKATHKEKKYTIGNRISAFIRKSRLSGMEPTVYFNHYLSYGIDNTSSNVDFLIESGHWAKDGALIHAKEFRVVYGRDPLIQWVEEHHKQGQLSLVTAAAWREIQKAITPERTPRYV